MKKICKLCGNIFNTPPSKNGNYCSRKCFSKTRIDIPRNEETKIKISEKNSGKGNGQWKGGRIKNNYGYINAYCPGHPYAHTNYGKGYVYEHRLVMERFLGRILRPEEQVHHINGIKYDNRIENLMLFTSLSEHMKYHNIERRKKKLEENKNGTS